MEHSIGIYAGTFDPITKGHLNIVQRSLKICDEVIIAVAKNNAKGPLLTIDERINITNDAVQEVFSTKEQARIKIVSFGGLLVDLCHEYKTKIVIRGLRAVSDFEYEFQISGVNKHLDEEIEMLYLMASTEYQFISSSLIKEIVRMNGDVSKFITNNVKEALHKLYKSSASPTKGNKKHE